MRFHYVSAYSFAHRKTSGGKRLQKATYAGLLSQMGLPSETGLQCARQVGAGYKGLWAQ
jgi:hypothetical protein